MGDRFLSPPDSRPQDGTVDFVTAADGVRLRAAAWDAGDRGTVLIFTGRSEYVEKCGPAAIDLGARGYSTASIDWRGQGLADRLLKDSKLGHVRDFRDYQRDCAALVDYVAAHNLPRPYYLIAHSMGGAIGLRALIEGLDVRAAVFSAPMWGVLFSPFWRLMARPVAGLVTTLRLNRKGTPGADKPTYVLSAVFEGNHLTGDRQMFDFMANMVRDNPSLALSGPTFGWLNQALKECHWLASSPLPPVPTLITLGSDEAIVDPVAIQRMVARWPSATLTTINGARHEVMMEGPKLRARFFDAAAALFDANN